MQAITKALWAATANLCSDGATRRAAANTAGTLPIATTAKVVGAMQHAARAEAATDGECYEPLLPCWQRRLV